MNKTVVPQELLTLVQAAPKPLRLVACSGSFDILHSGHVSYLREARAEGDALVVFLNTDQSITTYKGPGRPIISFSERAALLSAFPFVDYIIPFDEVNPLLLISTLKPAVFCNGADWGENTLERSAVESYGGLFKTVSAQTRQEVSTSHIIKKAHESYVHPPRRGLFVQIPIEENEATIVRIKEIIDTTEPLTRNNWKIFFILPSKQIEAAKNMIAALPGSAQTVAHLIVRAAQEYPADNPDTTRYEEAGRAHGLALIDSWCLSELTQDISESCCANMKAIRIGYTHAPIQHSHEIADFIAPNFVEAMKELISRVRP